MATHRQSALVRGVQSRFHYSVPPHYSMDAFDSRAKFEMCYSGDDPRSNAPPTPERPGHGYHGNSIRENARAQFGDNYATTVNYVLSESQREAPGDTARANFMRALSFDRVSFRRSVIIPAYASTNRCLFDTPEFLRWRDSTSPGHNFFWLRGKPGTGKSTIMKILVDYRPENMSNSLLISFFFNDWGHALEHSVQGLYRSMLHQLLAKVPRLFEDFRETRTFADVQTWSAKVLRGVLRDAVLCLQQERVLFLVDALDEGDEKEVRQMVEFFGDLAKSAHLKSIPVRLCFASRHYPNITLPQCEQVILEEQAKHAQDISRYILGTLNADDGPDKSNLIYRIERKARGVFLWAVLVVTALNEKHDYLNQDDFPLSRAARTGQSKIYDLLLSHGAKLSTTVGSGHLSTVISAYATNQKRAQSLRQCLDHIDYISADMLSNIALDMANHQSSSATEQTLQAPMNLAVRHCISVWEP